MLLANRSLPPLTLLATFSVLCVTLTCCSSSSGTQYGAPPALKDEGIPGSLGVQGKLHFAYLSSACAKGCAIDHPVLAGSTINILAEVPPNISLRFSMSGRGVTLEETMPKVCTSVDSCQSLQRIMVSMPGEAVLTAHNEDGWEIDHVTFRVEPAATLDLGLTACTPKRTELGCNEDETLSTAIVETHAIAQNAAGRYLLRVGEAVDVKASAFAASGETLEFSDGGSDPQTSDDNVLRSVERFDLLPKNIQTFIALEPGVATIGLLAQDTSVELPFEISE